MISLVLPYWRRQEATNKALRVLAELYAGLDLEVVIVDDGDPEPFIKPDLPLNIQTMHLQIHMQPRSPIHAWNYGVKRAKGEFIALSCPEVLHHKPVLQEMQAECERLGPKGYVLAAAWCPEQNRWHCHSSVRVPDCPKGTGLGFLGLMRRELFDLAGGFDEAYMAGCGHEDRDFIRALVVAGAQFRIRDDLVVAHPKTGAHTKWPTEGFAVNEKIFREKWDVPFYRQMTSIRQPCEPS